MLLGYLGIDQHSEHYIIKKHPRKELLEQLGRKHAAKMYCDVNGGGYREKGYVIGGRWIELFEVHAWKDGQVLGIN